MPSRRPKSTGEEFGLKLLQSVRQMKAGQAARVTKVEPNEVAQARQKSGLSQTEFADALGISKRSENVLHQRRLMSGYNTNLASEFYALSMLHRLGADANLTLGNKKSVDIAVIRGEGDSITVDVKGLAGKTGWPIDNIGPGTANHFIVFVCFEGKIADPTSLPLVWVVPSTKVPELTYNAPGGRKLMRVSTLVARGAKYKDAWSLLL